MHIGDGNREVLLEAKEKDEELMAARCWSNLGEKAYEDPSVPQELVNEIVAKTA